MKHTYLLTGALLASVSFAAMAPTIVMAQTDLTMCKIPHDHYSRVPH